MEATSTSEKPWLLDRWKLEDLREELAQVKEEAKEKVAPGFLRRWKRYYFRSEDH